MPAPPSRKSCLATSVSNCPVTGFSVPHFWFQMLWPSNAGRCGPWLGPLTTPGRSLGFCHAVHDYAAKCKTQKGLRTRLLPGGRATFRPKPALDQGRLARAGTLYRPSSPGHTGPLIQHVCPAQRRAQVRTGALGQRSSASVLTWVGKRRTYVPAASLCRLWAQAGWHLKAHFTCHPAWASRGPRARRTRPL